MIFTDANKEHSIKQMIMLWSKRLVEAIQEDDMNAAYDISRKTLPKCWDLYKQELRLNGKGNEARMLLDAYLENLVKMRKQERKENRRIENKIYNRTPEAKARVKKWKETHKEEEKKWRRII